MTQNEFYKKMRKMRKSFLLLFLSAIVVFSLLSCSSGNMEKLSFEEEGELLYGDTSYYRADNRFEVRRAVTDRAVDLGWHANFPFPEMHYHAFESEKPLVIFCDNGESATTYDKGVYVKADYDIYNALYIVNETAFEISLDDAMAECDVSSSEIDKEGDCCFFLYLKEEPRVQICLFGPFEYNGEWYATKGAQSWLLSESFLMMLNTR